MSLSTAQLVTKLRLHTGEDSTDLTDANSYLLLNQAYWELLDKFPFREKQTASTFSYVDGTRLYDAPTPFEAVNFIGVMDTDDNQWTRLKRMTLEWYLDKYNADSDAEGKPEYYARYGDQYYVYPTPDEAYSGVIYYATTLDDLAADESPAIPQVWHEIILYGAVWRRFLELGDILRANVIKDHQISLINSTSPVEAKEETDSKLAGVELPEELTQYP